jgi:transposase-like protein
VWIAGLRGELVQAVTLQSDLPPSLGYPRCTAPECAGLLGMSGQGVSRFVCKKCGQQYMLTLYFERVESREPLALPEDGDCVK